MTERKIKIDFHNVTELSPWLSGSNLEHTRGSMQGGLSAQMLRNRKFAGAPGRNTGCASEWFPIGGEAAFFENAREWDPNRDPSFTKHLCHPRMHRTMETQSQAVTCMMEGRIVGIGQNGLYLEKGKNYELRIHAHATCPISLKIALTDPLGESESAGGRMEFLPGDWQSHTLTLCPDRDESCGCLRITFEKQGKVVFGAVSLMPEENFHGMRPDVVALLKEIHPSLLRWPGGNFAGEYRWMDGLLPADERAPLQAAHGMEMETQPYSRGFDFHEINTDDFIALCREVGAEPFITINLVWSEPEENAAWVEYCNGSTDTEYGRKRAEHGHPEPYRVKFWSLGNEMGYSHMEGPSTPEKYAEYARRQAEAMLSADPELELSVSGPYPSEDWVKGSAVPLSDIAPVVSLHYYAQNRMDYSSPEAAVQTADRIVKSYAELSRLAEKMREMLPDGIHISFDEWNCWYSWHRPGCVPEGIFAAEMLQMLLRRSRKLDIRFGCCFQAVAEAAMVILPDRCWLTAFGQAMAFLKDHQGGALCKMSGEEEDEACATLKEGVVTVTLINTDMENSRSFCLELNGEVLESTVLCSDSILPHSRFCLQPQEFHRENGTLTAVLPSHSIAKIRIRI